MSTAAKLAPKYQSPYLLRSVYKSVFAKSYSDIMNAAPKAKITAERTDSSISPRIDLHGGGCRRKFRLAKESLRTE
jgi:hypothetical protein